MPDPSPQHVAHGLGLPDVRRAVRTSGFDAQVWRAELTDGRTVALRLLRAGVDPGRELGALRLATAHGSCAPAVLATSVVDGRAALALTWCPGRTIAVELEGGGDPSELGLLFGRAQARLHRPAAGSGAVLCHLDFHPFNVLVDDGEVSGVVDWSNARVADRRADLATTRVVLALAPALLPDAPGLDVFTASWAVGYGQLRAMPSDADLAPFLADAARTQARAWAPRAAAHPRAAAVAAGLVARWPR